MNAKLLTYAQLMRIDRPIGTLLLLWPMLWSLWLAAEGLPDLSVLLIFIAGAFVMRAAGCVINDFADRRFDAHVKRTRQRPFATGRVTVVEALALFVLLLLAALGLVLLLNPLTQQLALVGAALATIYPFMKRYTHLPQLVLGAAFSWSIPMAFAAQQGQLVPGVWLIFATGFLWTVVYDTFYAMVDRDDDLKIGIKSTAILFGDADRAITAVLQALVVLGWVLIGLRWQLTAPYWLGVAVAVGLFGYQQWLIRHRRREPCFQAFLNNNWVGAAVFVGIVAHYSFMKISG